MCACARGCYSYMYMWENFGREKLANLVNLSADTPKMCLAYAPTVAYSFANSFYLYGLPKIPPKISRV